jgi:hypothetical protein
VGDGDEVRTPERGDQRSETSIRDIERDVDVTGGSRDAIGGHRLRAEQVPPEMLSVCELGERDDRGHRLAKDAAPSGHALARA